MFSYFASPLMNKLTGLFSASQRRFLRFVLNINLRPYLRNPIQQGELDLQIETGRVELKDVELNEKTLNRKLGGNSAFTVKSGLVGSIAISVPWNNIRNENIKVTLSNIELIVVPGKNETFFEETVAPISLQSDEDEEEDNMPDDNTPDPTLNAMEKMFEGIFSNVEVTIHNLSIFLETSGSRSLHSTLSSLNISQSATTSSLNSNYTVDVHLAYAKIAKDTTQEGAHTIKFRDISVKIDEKPADASHLKDTTSDSTVQIDDVGITPRNSMSNNVILSYLSSDANLFDSITYKSGIAPTTPTGSPTRPNTIGIPNMETASKLEVAAKLTNSSLKCNLSLENYHRLMYIIGHFIDPPTPTPSPTTSAINPPPITSNTSPIRLSNSGIGPTNSYLTNSSLSVSSMGMSAMGMSSMGMNNLGASNLGSSILQFSAFFPQSSSSRLDNTFFSNGNLMDSGIFGTVEESRLEKSILTKYSAFSSWTPSLASQKVLLRLEIRSGSCNFVIPTENGKTMTTNVAFEGLVVKTKKLRVVQSLELRFNKFSVSADDETSNKPVVEVLGNSIRSSLSEHCFKASLSLVRSEETNDTTVNIEVQSRPIYLMYDSVWLDSIKKLSPSDSSSRSQAKKGKFSLHFKFHATSAHVVLPFPKKEGATYFPSRFGKRNWLVDLYLENFKVTHAAIGNIGNGKTHVLADGIVSYFGMKYESDAVKWLDIHRTAAAPVAKLVVRTKNPAPNPAHPGFNTPHSTASASASAHPTFSLSSAHSGHSTQPTSWNGQHTAQGAGHPRTSAQAQGAEHNRFSSPSFVFSGKKIDTRNLDVANMQKASAIVVEVALPPMTVEMSKDDYDILMEFIKIFSSDEESPMTHIDVSCPNVSLTLHDRKKQRLKKKKSEISAKTPTEVYYNTYRLNVENFDLLCSLSHFTTKSSLFVVRVDELEATVSDNNCTNQGEKIIPLLQKVTKRKPKHESTLTLVIPSLRVTGEDYQIALSDKLCGAPNISMLFGFVDWFTSSPPPSALSTSSILSTSSSSLSSSSKLSPNKNPPPISQLSSSLRSSGMTPPSKYATPATSSLRTSSGMTSSLRISSGVTSPPTPTHTQIMVPNVLLVHTPTNAGASQIVVSVEILTVSVITTSPGNSEISIKITGPRVLLSLLRNYPNLEPVNLSKYLMENNFKEILTLTPARSETLSSLEISMKFNEHATKSVISVDFENRKIELSTLADTFHALKLTLPLFLQSVSEHFLGDEGELGNVPIVTHADGSNGSTITLPQMAARYGDGLADSLLTRSWWGDAPEVRGPQSNLKKTREILSQGYFVVEHPENEEERKTFQSNLDVLRNTELVLEIEEEVEVDEVQQQEQTSSYEMDDSILDSWIVMGTDHTESIMNPESVIMICGLNFSWKIDIQKERHTSTSPSSAGSHVVLLVLDLPLIRYETFPDTWAHRKSMMLRVEFNDIRVEDHLLASVYRNVFTFDIPSSTSKKGNTRNTSSSRQSQNISVASVTFSARRAYGDITHYSAKIALAPVYLGVNQRTLDQLLDFFNRPAETDDVESEAQPSSSSTPVYFDKFQVSPLKLVVDYKPRGLEAMDYSKVVAGGYLWLVAMIPLECASFTLSEIDITNTTLDKLPEGIASTWMPNFLQTNIPQYIKGVAPIKIVAKMGSGVIGLVKVPIQEYKKDANILHGVGKGIQTLTFEVLNFGSRVTVSANKILRRTERMISGSPGRQPNEQKISSYANQPSDIREGAVQGMQVLLAALSGAADGIITRPLDEYQKNGKWGFVSTFLRGLPGCVLQPVIGVTGAVSKLTLGLRNTLDSKEKLKADAKYKSNDLSFEFQESNNNNYNSQNNSNISNSNDDEEYASTSQLASYEVMEDYAESYTPIINNNNSNRNTNSNINNNNNNSSNNNKNSNSNSNSNTNNRQDYSGLVSSPTMRRVQK